MKMYRRRRRRRRRRSSTRNDDQFNMPFASDTVVSQPIAVEQQVPNIAEMRHQVSQSRKSRHLWS
jgi:hypothetical protein